MSKTLQFQGPLAGRQTPDTFVAPDHDPEAAVVIQDLTDYALVQIVARKGQMTPLRRRLRNVLDAAAPNKPLTAMGDARVLLCATGPLELWALSEFQDEARLLGTLGEVVKDAACLYGQSHGRSVLRLSGPMAANVLAKGCPLDLHPRVFPTPGAGHTSIEKIPVLVVKRDDAPTFDLAVARSYAQSFLDWTCESAREFGYRIEPA
ncbi:MAG: sarcosine oxidase subunit gamma [Methyloligellaceae bacterium]